MTAGTRLIDKAKLVFGTAPANYSGAASTSDIVSFKDYNHATVIIQTGAWAGGTAAVTLKQATDVAGTGAKALSFAKMWTNDGDTTSDSLAEIAVASDTFNLDTANAMYVVEIDATDLDLANAFDCLRVDVASPGANADYYGVTIVLGHNARFGGNVALLPSALVD